MMPGIKLLYRWRPRGPGVACRRAHGLTPVPYLGKEKTLLCRIQLFYFVDAALWINRCSRRPLIYRIPLEVGEGAHRLAPREKLKFFGRAWRALRASRHCFTSASWRARSSRCRVVELVKLLALGLDLRRAFGSSASSSKMKLELMLIGEIFLEHQTWDGSRW